MNNPHALVFQENATSCSSALTTGKGQPTNAQSASSQPKSVDQPGQSSTLPTVQSQSLETNNMVRSSLWTPKLDRYGEGPARQIVSVTKPSMEGFVHPPDRFIFEFVKTAQKKDSGANVA
jgi:hypothetical protein